MSEHSTSEAAACPAAEQLLLTVGRAGVLSSRAIAAGELETLLCLLGPPSNVSGAASYVPPISSWSRTGKLIYWPRTGEQFTDPPMRWRACKRRGMSTAALRRELALLRSSLAALTPGRRARRCRRLGRTHHRADARSLAARCAALRVAAIECHPRERQEHCGRPQGRLDGAAGRPCGGGLAITASVRLPASSPATSSPLRPASGARRSPRSSWSQVG